MSLRCWMYVYKRLSVKSFHEVWAGNAHGYSLKSRIGKVSLLRKPYPEQKGHYPLSESVSRRLASLCRYDASSGGSWERGKGLTLLKKLRIRPMRVSTPDKVSQISKCSPALLFISCSSSFTRCAALVMSRTLRKFLYQTQQRASPLLTRSTKGNSQSLPLAPRSQ